MKDDNHNRRADPKASGPGEALNPGNAERDPAGKFSSMGGRELKDYFDLYPDFFRDQLEELYRERESDQFKFLFDFNEEMPSPLVWLLLNGPKRFLLACEECIIMYKKKYKHVQSGKRDRLGVDEQKEIVKIREELESHLLKLNLGDYQEKLQDKISEIYLEMSKLSDKDIKEDLETEYVEPMIYDNEWLFNNDVIESIEKKIQDFHQEIIELTGLLQEKGMLETVTVE
jgi:hypothetical protein